MKIGIISYWDSNHNYGQVLQCFAMQQWLRDRGHEPYHIRYTPLQASPLKKISKLIKATSTGKLSELLRMRREGNNPKVIELNNRQLHDCKENPRGFDDFRNKHIALSATAYDTRSIKLSPPEADAYIAGSDQIWGTPDDGYFLNFGLKTSRRIAYAPSLGGVAISKSFQSGEFRKLLNNLHVVTAREADGVEQCQSLGREDAIVVPDPVFLIPAETYRSIMKKTNETEPYILVYLLGNQIDLDVEKIFQWAESKNLKVKYVTAQGRFDDFPKIYPNIDEWLGLIDNAKYVLTNSFHGMVVSIILNKQFQVIPLSGSHSRMNSRLHTTLSTLGLESRIYSGKLDSISATIDFTEPNEQINRKRQEISRLFDQWLSDRPDADE